MQLGVVHSDHETARRIEEELVKDFANRSEMSDWFGREDMQKPERPLPLRPNPKNKQNASKIEELEAQIKKYIRPYAVDQAAVADMSL